MSEITKSRRRKNAVAMAICVALLTVIWALSGWKMAVITIGFCFAIAGLQVFIGWYLSDDE